MFVPTCYRYSNINNFQTSKAENYFSGVVNLSSRTLAEAELSLLSKGLNFANIFMGDFEDKFVYSYPLTPLIWKRFVDDIFFIWTYGDEKLKHFVNYLNTCHTTLSSLSSSHLRQLTF